MKMLSELLQKVGLTVSKMLDNFKIKVFYFSRALLIGTSVCLVLFSLLLIIFKDFYQEPLTLFPAILSVGVLSNVFRLNRLLKLGKDTINRLKVKYCLLEFGRTVFECMAYLEFANNRPWYGIIFSVLMVMVVVCENMIIRTEIKNIENTNIKN